MSHAMNLDFLFVTSGVPLYNRGGQGNLVRIVKRLTSDGYSVGVLHLRDVYQYVYHKTGSKLVQKFNDGRPPVHRLFEIIANTKFGYWAILPLARRLMSINHKDDTGGARLFFTERDLNGISAKRVIATAWQAAYFVRDTSIGDRKFYLVQHEEDDPSFSGVLSPLASKTYDFNISKIVQNTRVYGRFADEKPKRITVGMDLTAFPCRNPPESRDRKTVLIPLRMSEEKGAKYAVETIKKLHAERPDIKIVTFGNSPPRFIPDEVDHRGVISNDELVDLYNNASIFVLTSVIEGFGLPGLEAMSCGCAVVSTDSGGIREYLVDGFNGIIVPVLDPAAIKDSIISLVDDSPKRLEYANKGLETAKRFTLESMYKDLLEAID